MKKIQYSVALMKNPIHEGDPEKAYANIQQTGVVSLDEGYRVILGTIGSFAPSIKSSGALSKEAFTASNITDFKVKFAPGRSFDNLLRDAEFEKTATLRAKAATLSAELKGEDTVDISKPDGNAGEEEEPEP